MTPSRRSLHKQSASEGANLLANLAAELKCQCSPHSACTSRDRPNWQKALIKPEIRSAIVAIKQDAGQALKRKAANAMHPPKTSYPIGPEEWERN
jgi:hypothetical protein